MFFSKIKISIIMLLMSALILNAQSNLKIADMNAIPPVDPSIKTGKLPNGLTYYIKKNNKPENRMELRLAVKAGSLQETDEQNGLAHFCEHMAFNGTKNFPKSDLINYLESIGVEFGGDLNAYTSYDQTVYMLKVPTDNKEQMLKGIQVIEDWAHLLAFHPEEIDKERGVIIEEWRLGKGADDRVQRKHNPIIYYKAKHAKHDVIGDTAVLANFKHETLISFYKEWYRPELMAVIAVGDFDVAEIEKEIISKFSKLQGPKNPKPHNTEEIPFHKETLVSVAKDPELSFPNIQLMMKFNAEKEGTYKAYRTNIIHSLITEMINKRIAERQRKPNPPFGMFAMSYAGNFVGSTNTLGMFGLLKSENVEQGVEASIFEMFRAKQHGFSSSELERVKTEKLRFIEKTALEKDKTESANYANEYVRNFITNEAIPGIDYELELYKLWMPAITVNEINAEIAKLVNKENTVIAISAPEREGVKVPSDTEVLAMFNKISSQSLPAYIDETVNKPLFSKNVTPGKVVSKKEISKIGATELMLSNGVKVILKPTDFKNDEIMFTSFRFGGVSNANDDIYHSAAFSSQILSESGIGEFSNTDLSKLLSGKIVNVRSSIRETEEVLSGDCSPQDIEEMFQLIHLKVTEPRKDFEAFQSIMEKTASSLQDDKNDPRSVFFDSINSIVYNYHLRKLPWEISDLNKINLLKAIDFYKSRFANVNGFNFVFVGNFDINKITPLIEKYIGSLPSDKKEESFKDLGIKFAKGNIDRVVKKGIEKQGMVSMMINGEIDLKGDERFQLNALIDAFNIRLREVIREEKSGTYGAYAYPSFTSYPKSTYTINIGFGCDPDRASELSNEIMKLIKEITTEKVTETNIQKVKEQLLKSLEVSMKENRFWMSSIYNAYYNNDNPEKIVERKQQIESLNANRLFEVAKKYFRTDNLAKFVLMPEN